MKNLLLFALGIIGICTACEENVDYKWGNPEPRLVVDGMLTNESFGSFVHLTLSDTVVQKDEDWWAPVPVNDALVIISDDMGNADTLKRRYEYQYEWDTITYNYIKVDSGYNERGYYDVKKGIPDHTYYLTIKYKGKEYHATTRMVEAPTIDTIYFQKRYNDIKYEDEFLPLISFPLIEEASNNYMFVFGSMNYVTYDNINTLVEQMTLLRGEFLRSYVSGLDVCQGYSPDYWRKGYLLFFPGDSVHIAMYSISPEGYKFYEALTRQIEQYDGVFNPAPTTPQGNISGGALGYFGASAVSRIKGKIPE